VLSGRERLSEPRSSLGGEVEREGSGEVCSSLRLDLDRDLERRLRLLNDLENILPDFLEADKGSVCRKANSVGFVGVFTGSGCPFLEPLVRSLPLRSSELSTWTSWPLSGTDRPSDLRGFLSLDLGDVLVFVSGVSGCSVEEMDVVMDGLRTVRVEVD